MLHSHVMDFVTSLLTLDTMKKTFWAIISLAGVLTYGNAQSFDHQLTIPPIISNDTFNLEMIDTLHEFNSGVFTPTFGFNGTYLGPTLEMQKGDTVQMYVTNHIGDSSSVHWHGLHIPSAMDGGPHTLIYNNATWSPSFTVMNNASTCWYHPHMHESTMPQVNKGLAGMIIIRDPAEAQLALPRTYGADDFPLVLQDRSFNGSGQIVYNALADSVVINGTTRPYLDAPAQVVRMRVLNGANARVFEIAFSDNRPFYVIASDGGMIGAPDTVTSLKITNGERYEILVDFTNDNVGDSLFLICKGASLASAEPGGSGMQSGASPLNGINYNMMLIHIAPQLVGAVTTIPATLIPVTPWNTANAVRTRNKVMQGTGMYDMGNMNINGLVFDMMVINDTIYKDDIEIWNITNTSVVSHPFHLHDVQFYVFERNGNAPQGYESGLKDVIYLKGGESVKFITKFEDFTDSVIPYMYHCHNLHHEDMGMMLQFIVIEDPNVIVTEQNHSDVNPAFPNPTSDYWTVPVNSISPDVAQWTVYDNTGKIVLQGNMNTGNGNVLRIDATSLPVGLYHLEMILPEGRVNYRLSKIE